MKGLQNVFVTMGYDSESKEYILKLINLRKQEVVLQTAVKGFGKRYRHKNNIESGTRQE